MRGEFDNESDDDYSEEDGQIVQDVSTVGSTAFTAAVAAGASDPGEEFGNTRLHALRLNTQKMINARRFAGGQRGAPKEAQLRRFDMKMTEQEKRLVEGMLGSWPLMRKCCELLELFQQQTQKAKAAAEEGNASGVSPAELMGTAAMVIHQVKFCTARDCWRNYLLPVQEACEAWKRKYDDIKSQFTAARMEWLREVSTMRDAVARRRNAPEGTDTSAAEDLDLKMFMDPVNMLTDAETQFALQVINEKMKMIFTRNENAKDQVDLRQIEAWSTGVANSQAARLRKELQAAKQKIEELMALVHGKQTRAGQDIGKLMINSSNAAHRLETLQAMNMASEVKLADSQNRIAELEAEIERMTTEREERMAENFRQLGELSRMRTQLVKSEEARAHDQLLADTATTEERRMKEELQIVKEALKDNTIRLRAHIQDLRTQNDELKAAVYGKDGNEADKQNKAPSPGDKSRGRQKSSGTGESADWDFDSLFAADATLEKAVSDFEGIDWLHVKIAELEDERHKLKHKIHEQAKQIALLRGEATLEQVEDLTGAVLDLIGEDLAVQGEGSERLPLAVPKQSIEALEASLKEVSASLSLGAAKLREMVMLRHQATKDGAEAAEDFCTEEFVQQEETVAELRSKSVRAEVMLLAARFRDLRAMADGIGNSMTDINSSMSDSLSRFSIFQRANNMGSLADALNPAYFQNDEESGRSADRRRRTEGCGVHFEVGHARSEALSTREPEDLGEDVGHTKTWADPSTGRKRVTSQRTAAKVRAAVDVVNSAMGLLGHVTEKLRDVASENVWLRTRAVEATTEMQRAAIALQGRIENESEEVKQAVKELGAVKMPAVFERLYNSGKKTPRTTIPAPPLSIQADTGSANDALEEAPPVPAAEGGEQLAAPPKGWKAAGSGGGGGGGVRPQSRSSCRPLGEGLAAEEAPLMLVTRAGGAARTLGGAAGGGELPASPQRPPGGPGRPGQRLSNVSGAVVIAAQAAQAHQVARMDPADSHGGKRSASLCGPQAQWAAEAAAIAATATASMDRLGSRTSTMPADRSGLVGGGALAITGAGASQGLPSPVSPRAAALAAGASPKPPTAGTPKAGGSPARPGRLPAI